MAQVIALSPRTSIDVALATPTHEAAPSGLASLPEEWQLVVDVAIPGGPTASHVVVGPNGIFSIAIDPDPMPAIATIDGLFRGGVRVTTPVKNALSFGHEVRRHLPVDVLAYPILVSRIAGDRHHLDRLGVVPGDRIAEHIWSHPGTPLRRSQRGEVLWALRHLAS